MTNLDTKAQQVAELYNGRGTAEQSPTGHSFGDGAWIKEGKYGLHWTRLSCHRFVANQVRLAVEDKRGVAWKYIKMPINRV